MLTFEAELLPWAKNSCGREGSSSTKNREPNPEFGSASGASDSNSILSEGICRNFRSKKTILCHMTHIHKIMNPTN